MKKSDLKMEPILYHVSYTGNVEHYIMKPYFYHLVTSGEGVILTNENKKFSFQKGTLFCTFTEEEIAIHAEKPWSLGSIQLNVRREYRPGFRCYPAEATQLFARTFQLALDIQDANPTFQESLLKGFQSILTTLVIEMGANLRHINQDVFDILRTAYENIPNPEFDINEELRKKNYSEGYLRKQIISETGNAPVKFLNLIRIERAKELLNEATASVAIHDIAVRCGYNDPLYFTRLFKKITGMTPTEYYQSHHK